MYKRVTGLRVYLFSAITDGDLLSVGEKYGLGTAQRVLAEVRKAVG